jgi:hypothetical protein
MLFLCSITINFVCFVVNILSWRLNSQPRHVGLDPASNIFLDSRLRGNDDR